MENSKSDTLVRLQCAECYKMLGEACNQTIGKVRIKCKKCQTLNEFTLPELKIKPIYNNVKKSEPIKTNRLIKVVKKNNIQNDFGVKA